MSLQDTTQHGGQQTAYKPLDLVPMLGLGRSTIYRLLRAGAIRSVKAGRRTVVPAEAVAEFLNGGK